MKFSDFFHFFRQIFFPKRKQDAEEADIATSDDSQKALLEAAQAASLLVRLKKALNSRISLSSFFSILAHLLILLILAIVAIPVVQEWEGIDMLSRGDLPNAQLEADVTLKPEDFAQNTKSLDEALPGQLSPVPALFDLQETVKPDVELIPKNETDTSENGDLAANQKATNASDVSFQAGGGYEGRRGERKAQILSAEMEVGDDSGGGRMAAIERALEWIAAHQEKDGGWSFDFENSCNLCHNSGTHGSRIAATSLAVLAFLGNGETHRTGRYQKQVSGGINFLLLKGLKSARGLDLTSGEQGMYSHGLATLALCEAFGMENGPENLGRSAQEALRFIENAQVANLGGWRYTPNEPMGDLAVTAWQVMALKSGKLANLAVMQPTLYLVNDFLNSVAYEQGRMYRYLPDPERVGTGPDSRKTCTGCGLLLRMYLGWKPGEKALDGGIAFLEQWGPLLDTKPEPTGQPGACNLYYAYYATLVMHHYGGSNWPAWNKEIRDFLIVTQSEYGHESGSWFFSDHYCDAGGRLLNTTLGVMILETPFRYMPLYRE